MMVQFWQVSVAVWEVWYRHVKHVFAILHHIENEIILGRNKTWTSKIKNQKWDVRVHRRSKKIHPPTKMGNVLFAKSHPEHEYDKILTCLFKKRSGFDPRSLHDYDVSFCQRDWEELVKAKKKTLPVSCSLFQPLFLVLLSQHPWLLSFRLFEILGQFKFICRKKLLWTTFKTQRQSNN